MRADVPRKIFIVVSIFTQSNGFGDIYNCRKTMTVCFALVSREPEL